MRTYADVELEILLVKRIEKGENDEVNCENAAASHLLVQWIVSSFRFTYRLLLAV